MHNRIKKAFLLAAGHGVRLRPITDTIPKCLVPIRGVPLLQIWLEQCLAYGINEVLINLHAHGEVVSRFLREFPSRVNVTVSEENVLLGSAGTLAANRDWIGEEKHFWVFYADVLSCIDLRKMAHFHFASRMLATIGLYHVPDPGRCGIVTLDDNHIVKEFVEKPARPTSSLAFSGVMIAMSEILELIPASRPADIGFHVLPQLVGKMAGYPISEYLIDIGTMENYCQAQETWPGGTLKDRDACSQQ